MRICIPSLGSLEWGDQNSEVSLIQAGPRYYIPNNFPGNTSVPIQLTKALEVAPSYLQFRFIKPASIP